MVQYYRLILSQTLILERECDCRISLVKLQLSLSFVLMAGPGKKSEVFEATIISGPLS
jgi:hypothetical protein